MKRSKVLVCDHGRFRDGSVLSTCTVGRFLFDERKVFLAWSHISGSLYQVLMRVVYAVE